jgi:hypothetical protein
MDMRKVNKGDFLTIITITSDRKKRKFIEIIEIYCVNEGSAAGSQITAEILKDPERFSQHYFEGAVEYKNLNGFRKSRLNEIFKHKVISTNYNKDLRKLVL